MDFGDTNGVDMALGHDDPVSRTRAFRPAEPLDAHVLQSLAFLDRIHRVALTGGDKKTFEFTIHLHTNPLDNDVGSTWKAAFTIRRSAQEIDRVAQIVRDACSRHVDLHAYAITPCQLCTPFRAKVAIPISVTSRLRYRTETIHKLMEQFVVTLVLGARVPPTNEKLYCEGVTRVPAAVTKFLLTGVDQATLAG